MKMITCIKSKSEKNDLEYSDEINREVDLEDELTHRKTDQLLSKSRLVDDHRWQQMNIVGLREPDILLSDVVLQVTLLVGYTYQMYDLYLFKLQSTTNLDETDNSQTHIQRECNASSCLLVRRRRDE